MFIITIFCLFCILKVLSPFLSIKIICRFMNHKKPCESTKFPFLIWISIHTYCGLIDIWQLHYSSERFMYKKNKISCTRSSDRRIRFLHIARFNRNRFEPYVCLLNVILFKKIFWFDIFFKFRFFITFLLQYIIYCNLKKNFKIKKSSISFKN